MTIQGRKGGNRHGRYFDWGSWACAFPVCLWVSRGWCVIQPHTQDIWEVGMEAVWCERMRWYTGPAMCKACDLEGCQLKTTWEGKNEPGRNEGKRVRERTRVMRMVERQLYNRHIYEVTGFPIHSDRKQPENVSPTLGMQVAKGKGEGKLSFPSTRKKLGKIERPKLGGIK